MSSLRDFFGPVFFADLFLPPSLPRRRKIPVLDHVIPTFIVVSVTLRAKMKSRRGIEVSPVLESRHRRLHDSSALHR